MDITEFWQLPQTEQARIQTQLEQEAQVNAPAHLPGRYTLANVFDAGEHGVELAVCASDLFILIVQDRIELGGGYGVLIMALFKALPIRHFETRDEVETYLAAMAPYTRNAPVWIPLPSYHSKLDETELLKQIWQHQEVHS